MPISMVKSCISIHFSQLFKTFFEMISKKTLYVNKCPIGWPKHILCDILATFGYLWLHKVVHGYSVFWDDFLVVNDNFFSLLDTRFCIRFRANYVDHTSIYRKFTLDFIGIYAYFYGKVMHFNTLYTAV
jgi:hypothetical protein